MEKSFSEEAYNELLKKIGDSFLNARQKNRSGS